MANSISSQLLAALAKIDRPGTFCTQGQLPTVVPGLEVRGVGAVAQPLTKSAAAKLKKQAIQAPYGKGTQTLVDTKVRRVWEIDASAVKLANPEWAALVQQAVRAAQVDLGLEKQSLKSHLYKLLLYEPGSFFLPHRDGEKLDRMVATLVIVLPSAYKGGELIVRHDGRKETINFGGSKGAFHVHFAAFYADCEHEVRPVTSGFRLALVYNLTLAATKAKSKSRLKAPTSGEHVEALGQILQRWSQGVANAPPAKESKAKPANALEEPAPNPARGISKLAVLLDHKYTKAGLAFDALKGVDRAKAAALFAAAGQSQCDAHLALVTLWESGEADPSEGYGGYRRSRYYEEDEEDAGDHEMGEIFDSTLTAEHFSDAAGHRPAFSDIPLHEDELVSAQPIREKEPDQEDFEGFTGNAGMTLERWYHRAAVVLWPAAARFDVLCESGVQAAVGGLEQLVKQWKKAKKSERPGLQEQCRAFAARIIAHWPECEYAADHGTDKKPNSDPLLTQLQALGGTALITAWLRNVLARDPNVAPGKMLGDICHQHGWSTFADDLQRLIEHTSNETIERNARLLANWCLRRDKNAARQELCKSGAHAMLSALQRWDGQKDKLDWHAKKVDRAALVPPLVQAFVAVQEFDLLETLVKHLHQRPQLYDITKVQVPALVALQPWLKRNVKQPCPSLNGWLTAVRDVLQARAAKPPLKPADWRRVSAIPCNCEICRELSRFLDDPLTKTLRFPLAKQRRQHAHNAIDSNRLDLTHITERRGSPCTLVCTKTYASYERAKTAHQLDCEQLELVQSLVDWHAAL